MASVRTPGSDGWRRSFGLAVLLAALGGIAAVLSSRVSERLRIPAPAFFLIGAAAASDVWPRLGSLTFAKVEQVVTVALAVILFDGGMRMGWRRFRSAAGDGLGRGGRTRWSPRRPPQWWRVRRASTRSL